MKAHPWWPQLWGREVLCEGGALRDLLVTRIAPQITRTIADRFAAAQARGEMNADLDPRLLMTSLIGLTLLPAAGAPIWRTLFDADDLGLDDVRRHALALLDRGLALKGPGPCQTPSVAIATPAAHAVPHSPPCHSRRRPSRRACTPLSAPVSTQH